MIPDVGEPLELSKRVRDVDRSFVEGREDVVVLGAEATGSKCVNGESLPSLVPPQPRHEEKLRGRKAASKICSLVSFPSHSEAVAAQQDLLLVNSLPSSLIPTPEC